MLDWDSLVLAVGVVDGECGDFLAFVVPGPLFGVQQVEARGQLLNLDAGDLVGSFETAMLRFATRELN
jgi:hypothetical protein